jgi:hypothetical protein
MTFNLPVGGNEKLRRLVEAIDADPEVQAYLQAANVTAIDRMGMNDHGYTHSRIVANVALKILRILLKRGVVPSSVEDHGLAVEDAEVIVVLGAVFHDVGMAVHREGHVEYAVPIAFRLFNKLLEGIYGERERALVISEALHPIVGHEAGRNPLTLEAGIVTVSDALDMAGGRARIPFTAGKVDIHSVSAMAVERVEITEGEEGERPLQIRIEMANSSGIFQIDGLLRPRVEQSRIREHIRITAEVRGRAEKRIVERFEIEI